MFGMPDPTKYHIFFDDFDDYEAAQWIISTTEAGTGAAAEAVSSADGGILVLTNDDADNDCDFLQWSGVDAAGAIEAFKFEAGKKLFFKSRFKVSSATQSDVVMGLQITDTSPLDASDGVFFLKADDAKTMVAKVVKASAATISSAIATLADDTYLTAAFYYDGKSEVQVFIDDVKVATLPVINLPDSQTLTVSFGVQNGSAGAKTMSVDYIFVAKER